MTYRKLILATGTCAGLLIAASSLAMPITVPKLDLASAINLVDDDGSDGDDDHRTYRGHHDRHGDHSFRKHDREDDDDDDDDDDDGNRAMQPQNDTAPANGLFTPGAKPKVQIN
ncbi:MAG: hypothetical protein RLZZ444_3965 [Pseudomonadota bacterium]|jgi:hypothetical protein